MPIITDYILVLAFSGGARESRRTIYRIGPVTGGHSCGGRSGPQGEDVGVE